MLPSMVLKKMVMGNFGSEQMDPDVADSVDFMVEKVSMIWISKCWNFLIPLKKMYSWRVYRNQN